MSKAPAAPKAVAPAPAAGTTNDPKTKPTETERKYIMGLVELLGVDDEKADKFDDERHDPAGFTKDYLQRTSLHGLQ